MSLPTITTKKDVDTVVSYLKTKVAGATPSEMKAAVDAKIIDKRKIDAYVQWGFVVRDGRKLKLTERGRDYSRASTDRVKDIYKELIHENHAYNIAAEWFFHRNLDQVTNVELASHWHEHCKEDLGTEIERSITDQVTCFFNIAEASGIGTLTIGRRGQPTRLVINREELNLLIGSMPSVNDERLSTKNVTEDNLDLNNKELDTGVHATEKEDVSLSKVKVFITHGKNMEIVDQVKTMLELSSIQHEVAVEEETTAIPIPDKIFSAMRSCNAAIICVTADENMKLDDGTYAINQNVLIEIGAAFVLYDKRVVLVWDKRISVPSNIQGLYRCEYEGKELSWSTGMKLMKAISTFKGKNAI